MYSKYRYFYVTVTVHDYGGGGGGDDDNNNDSFFSRCFYDTGKLIYSFNSDTVICIAETKVHRKSWLANTLRTEHFEDLYVAVKDNIKVDVTEMTFGHVKWI
jgi:hypothetical protein